MRRDEQRLGIRAKRHGACFSIFIKQFHLFISAMSRLCVRETIGLLMVRMRMMMNDGDRIDDDDYADDNDRHNVS